MLAPGKGRPLSFPIISAMIRPFGACHEVLTADTIKTYFIPIVVSYIQTLDSLDFCVSYQMVYDRVWVLAGNSDGVSRETIR